MRPSVHSLFFLQIPPRDLVSQVRCRPQMLVTWSRGRSGPCVWSEDQLAKWTPDWTGGNLQSGCRWAAVGTCRLVDWHCIWHWSLGKIVVISQTTFSNAFSWMKMYEFRLRFHWSFFLRLELTIFQHWFKYWLRTDQATSHYMNQYWRIYASLGLNEWSEEWRHMNNISNQWRSYNLLNNLLKLVAKKQSSGFKNLTFDWNPRIVMMLILSSLVAWEVVITTTSGATSNNKVGIMTTLCFQRIDGQLISLTTVVSLYWGFLYTEFILK